MLLTDIQKFHKFRPYVVVLIWKECPFGAVSVTVLIYRQALECTFYEICQILDNVTTFLNGLVILDF